MGNNNTPAPLKKYANTTNCQLFPAKKQIDATTIETNNRKVLNPRNLVNSSFLYIITVQFIQSRWIPMGIPSLEISDIDSDQVSLKIKLAIGAKRNITLTEIAIEISITVLIIFFTFNVATSRGMYSAKITDVNELPMSVPGTAKITRASPKYPAIS